MSFLSTLAKFIKPSNSKVITEFNRRAKPLFEMYAVTDNTFEEYPELEPVINSFKKNIKVGVHHKTKYSTGSTLFIYDSKYSLMILFKVTVPTLDESYSEMLSRYSHTLRNGLYAVYTDKALADSVIKLFEEVGTVLDNREIIVRTDVAALINSDESCDTIKADIKPEYVCVYNVDELNGYTRLRRVLSHRGILNVFTKPNGLYGKDYLIITRGIGIEFTDKDVKDNLEHLLTYLKLLYPETTLEELNFYLK